MPKRVAVVGAGWAGASAARALADAGVDVRVFESAAVAGGHSRAEVLAGVVYEPNGPHIFHTDDERVARLVRRFGMRRRFDFRPLTRLRRSDGDDRLLSWPLRLDELRELPEWPSIARELERRPARPDATHFESWCVSLLGETLYRWFVYGYTVKQWGCEPSRLSSRFAPKRVDLRENGHHGLFRDRWQFFPPRGVNSVIDAMLDGIAVQLDTTLTLRDLEAPELAAFDHVVVTAPLDEFAGPEAGGRLAWRGIRVDATFHSTEELGGTVTPGYAVNEPSADVPFTRTVETKHATGQRVRGTVVCREYPGSAARHYPIHTPENTYERENERLQAFVRDASPRPVSFCGRLASYRYLNQDEAILEGLRAADAILAR
jgi:UDP-galactopyranose mutase